MHFLAFYFSLPEVFFFYSFKKNLSTQTNFLMQKKNILLYFLLRGKKGDNFLDWQKGKECYFVKQRTDTLQLQHTVETVWRKLWQLDALPKEAF